MKEELQQIDQRSQKLKTMLKTLHPRDDIDRLYVLRNSGRAFASIDDTIDASIKRLQDFIKKSKEKLITRTRNKQHKDKYNGNN